MRHRLAHHLNRLISFDKVLVDNVVVAAPPVELLIKPDVGYRPQGEGEPGDPVVPVRAVDLQVVSVTPHYDVWVPPDDTSLGAVLEIRLGVSQGPCINTDIVIEDCHRLAIGGSQDTVPYPVDVNSRTKDHGKPVGDGLNDTSGISGIPVAVQNNTVASIFEVLNQRVKMRRQPHSRNPN
jgi:hypothetical protein